MCTSTTIENEKHVRLEHVWFIGSKREGKKADGVSATVSLWKHVKFELSQQQK